MKHLKLIVHTVAAWLATLLIVFPLIWLVITAFKTEQQAIAIPPELFFTPTLESFAEVNLHHLPANGISSDQANSNREQGGTGTSPSGQGSRIPDIP